MVIALKLLQFSKALLFMDVTDVGIEIDVKPVQPLKAELPMETTVFGIVEFLQPAIMVLSVFFIIALQEFRLS